jgi:hypothetical protein
MPAGRVNRGPQLVVSGSNDGVTPSEHQQSKFQGTYLKLERQRQHFLQQPRSKGKRTEAKGRSHDKYSPQKVVLHCCEFEFVSQ